MFVAVLASLLLAACSADIPPPKLLHLPSGDLQLSVDNVPGLEVLQVKYSFSKNHFQGAFKQSADGRWHHKHTGVEKYDGRDKIKYTMIGMLNGKVVVSKGKIIPEGTGTALLPPVRVRRGTVVYRDDFDSCNIATLNAHWDFEVSMYGGHNGEFQAYVPDAKNIFCKNGHLFIKPTLTRDHPGYSDAVMHTAVMDLKAMYGYCTEASNNGCYRDGHHGVLPPVMSGKLKSKKTIKFGKVVVAARVPKGDWIWPAIWMLPKHSEYGGWPRSGEIDMMESRGNSVAQDGSHNRGRNEVGATLHWGPDAAHNKFTLTHGSLNGDWSSSIHIYRLEWTVDHIEVFVDDHHMMQIPTPPTYWQRGGFTGNNLWAHGTKAAPFDKDFYLILNVAIGGTMGFFPDNWHYNSRKPWQNHGGHPDVDFWHARNEWLPSWVGDDVAMEIDYVEMTQY